MKKLIFNLIKLISLVLFCLIASFLVVLPLYFFSTKSSNLYTIVGISILLLTMIYFIVKICKNNSIKRNIVIALCTVIIISGLYTTFIFITQENRIMAIISLVLTPMLCIFTSLITKIRSKNEK
ncbi:MAG: hypothetical protein IIU99_06095 [Treponema sp.]|nr:hypothetical protein [Treponema sp.]MBQ5877077.1 hypothetical protein [Treponema sp.]